MIRRWALAAALLLPLATPAWAQKVSTMQPASTPLSGAELFYCVQSGQPRKCTVSQIGGSSSAGGVAANNAALRLIPSTLGVVLRAGFAQAGDAPELLFQASSGPCSLNGGAGDGGSQVPTSDGKCWLAVFPENVIDVREYGVFPTVTNVGPLLQSIANIATGHAIYLPIGTYTCNANATQPIAIVMGPSCFYFYQQHDFKFYGPGTLVFNTGNNIGNLINVIYSDHFEMYDLHLLANFSGVPGGNTIAGMEPQFIHDAYFHDIWWDGDWGSNYTAGGILGDGFAGSAWSDVTLTRLHMPKVGECFDDAFWRRVTVTDSELIGSNGLGGPSSVTCFHLERDSFTAAYYPADTAALSDNTNRDVVISGNKCSGFQYCGHISLGHDIAFIGNTFHDAPGAVLANPGDLPSLISGGIALNYYVLATSESYTDPPHNITLTGNILANDGTTTDPGGGLVIGTGDVPTNAQWLNYSSTTITTPGSGYHLNDRLTGTGGTCTNEPQVVVLAINGSGGVTSIGQFASGTCSVPPSNPITFTGGAGSGFQLTASAWVAPPPIQNIMFADNVLDNNTPSGATAPSPNFLSNVTIGSNSLSGAAQTTPYAQNVMLNLGPGSKGKTIEIACSPAFNPGTALTQFCSGPLSTGVPGLPAIRSGLFSGLSINATNAPGAGHTYTFTLTIVGATPITCTISGASQTSCVDNTHTAYITAGQGYELQIVADAAAAAAAQVSWSTNLLSP